MSSDEYSDEDAISESSRIMPPVRFLKLIPYLDLLRDAAFTPAQTWVGKPPSLTLVMGNPSADLDSFISSVVLGYFLNSGPRGGSPMYGVRKTLPKEHASRSLYMSLLNMPKVNSQSDLHRLRPEFGVALRWAFKTGNDDRHDIKWANEEPEEVEKFLCRSLLTIFDLIKYDQAFQNFKPRFRPTDKVISKQPTQSKQPLILVDHNAPSIPPLSSEHLAEHFSLIGCIDHHIDENIVPVSPNTKPRIIQTGIGSCASLVINHLRDSDLWPDITTHIFDSNTKTYIDGDRKPPSELHQSDISAIRQISALALAPILIDTSNLHAAGEKCSDLDKQTVEFLESQINFSPSEIQLPPLGYSRNQFYTDLSKAKVNSLDNLRLPEILERDYKQWASPSYSGDQKSGNLNLGISTIVKPISWILEHPCGNDASIFPSSITAFSSDPDRNLGIYVFSTRGVQDKAKELGAVAFTEAGVRAIDLFEKQAGKELGLEAWTGDDTNDSLRAETRKAFGGENMTCRLWWMKRFDKTRKQVAPLMRDAIEAVARGQE